MLNVKRDATGMQSYDVAVRNLDGAGPHTRGVEIAKPATMALGARRQHLHVDGQEHRLHRRRCRLRAGRWTTRTPYVGSDVYRLKATGGDVHLTNEIVAIKAGESVDVPVYFKGTGSVTLTATSESDPSKVAIGTCAPGTVGGTVPATLSLSVGSASFGAFTPGVTRDYTASTNANVISTAGDATLTVGDPSSTATGHLVNGSFSLPQPLRAKAHTATNPGSALVNVGSGAHLLTWAAPASNDAVTIDFAQRIEAGDALRTGSYAKTLTFTLSTTNP